MCMLPDHKTFRNEHVVPVVEGLEKGLYEGIYNHQDSSCCVVGLALAHFTGQPISAGDTGSLMSEINDPRLHALFNTFEINDMHDQSQGAAKGRKYLAETKEFETV